MGFFKKFLFHLSHNLLTTVKVDRYETDSFSIKFPQKWSTKRFSFNQRYLEFYNFSEINGLILISSYTHSDPSFQYDIYKELGAIEKIKDHARIVNLPLYKAIGYGDNYSNKNMLQYLYVIGDGRRKLIITLTMNNRDEDVEKAYAKFKVIISNIRLKS